MGNRMMLPAAFALCTTVHAQNSGPGNSEGEGLIEIIVTAQKRAQGLPEVPASVTALAGQIGSVQINHYSPTITLVNLRGASQNNLADSQEAPIAFYTDEVHVSALGAISRQAFDHHKGYVENRTGRTLEIRNSTKSERRGRRRQCARRLHVR